MKLATVVSVVFLAAPRVFAGDFVNPEPVEIEGYSGDVMEPFLLRDGRILLFNNSNAPDVNTDIFWAERVAPLRFRFRGKVEGADADHLDGVPSVDRDRMLYFISTRSYATSLSTIYRGAFEDGRAEGVALVEGVSRKEVGSLNFDAEISADGAHLYVVDGHFSGGVVPDAADIFIARRIGEGFERLPASDAIMANINTQALEYAPATSADELELFFTRLTHRELYSDLRIMHATRESRDEPFGEPLPIEAITGFVEAPTVGADGNSLYYHQKVDGRYRLFRVTRPPS